KGEPATQSAPLQPAMNPVPVPVKTNVSSATAPSAVRGAAPVPAPSQGQAHARETPSAPEPRVGHAARLSSPGLVTAPRSRADISGHTVFKSVPPKVIQQPVSNAAIHTTAAPVAQH